MIKIKREPIELLERQLKFYGAMSSNSVPIKIVRIESTSYGYEHIKGREALNTKWGTLYDFFEKNVWNKVALAGEDIIDKEGYLNYVTCIGVGIIPTIVKQTILNAKLTPCLTHGDATLENIIINKDNQLRLIDPGMPRGLSCKELDEAKMAQCYITGWCECSTGRKNNGNIEPIIIALLYTHWMRLIAHPEKHDEKIMSIGRKIILPELERRLYV